MIKKLRNYILTGLFVTLPLIMSIAITVWLLKIVTNGVINLIPYSIKGNLFLNSLIRLATLVSLMAILAFIGLVAKLVFIRKTFSIGEKLLVRIPLFNKIYISIKQISHAFWSEEKTIFNRVVLVEYPRKGIYSLGFITEKTRGEIQKRIHAKDNLLNIFVPTTPNPTSGMLIIARQEEVILMDMRIEDGMKLVISGGAIMPPEANAAEK